MESIQWLTKKYYFPAPKVWRLGNFWLLSPKKVSVALNWR